MATTNSTATKRGLLSGGGTVGGSSAETLVYGGLWFAGSAVGFLVIAARMTDWSRWLYFGAAVANLAAAVVQGLPTLYHATRLRR